MREKKSRHSWQHRGRNWQQNDQKNLAFETNLIKKNKLINDDRKVAQS